MTIPTDLTTKELERFWGYVDKSDSGCWLWTGGKSHGYGAFQLRGRVTSAHRLSYSLHNSPPTSSQVIRHKCDTPACVNPDHLETGTYADNSRDMVTRSRQAQGERSGRATLTAKEVRRARQLVLDGVPKREVARILGRDRSAVLHAIVGRTWNSVQDPPPIPPSPVKSASPETIETMISLRKQGWTFQRIAEHTGFSQTGVGKILHKHLSH